MNAYVGLNSTRIWEADLSDLETCARIDSFVMARHDSTPFHRPAWSRAIERGTGARAHYLVAERDGYIVAVLPCHEIRSRLFGHALVSSGFAVGGGILGDWPGLAGQMLSLALQKECLVAETRGGSLPPGGWQADDQTYVGFVRDLADDDLSELARMPRKRRAEIRKAMTFGLTHKAGSGINARVMHYQVFSEMVRNLGTPVFPSALFTEVLKTFGQDADILSVFQGETVLASVLTLYHRGTAYPYWGGAPRRRGPGPPMSICITP
jgi:hypothetical protein